MSAGLRTWLGRRVRALTGADRLAAAALVLPVGQISLQEARCLGELVRDLESPGPIVEIGTLFGRSTLTMTLFKSPQRPLITVDNYSWNPLGLSPARHRRCTADVLSDAVRLHNVRIVESDKSAFYRGYDGPAPALVFLDAVHTYEETRADLDWAKRAGAHLICVHDYGEQFPGVVRAVDEFGRIERLVESLAVLARA